MKKKRLHADNNSNNNDDNNDDDGKVHSFFLTNAKKKKKKKKNPQKKPRKVIDNKRTRPPVVVIDDDDDDSEIVVSSGFFAPRLKSSKVVHTVKPRKKRRNEDVQEVNKRVDRFNEGATKDAVFHRDVVRKKARKSLKNRRKGPLVLKCTWPKISHVFQSNPVVLVPATNTLSTTRRSDSSKLIVGKPEDFPMCDEEMRLILHSTTDLKNNSGNNNSSLVVDLASEDECVSAKGFVTSDIGCRLCTLWARQMGNSVDDVRRRLMTIAERKVDNSTKYDMWTRRYVPQAANELFGNDETISFIEQWLRGWKRSSARKNDHRKHNNHDDGFSDDGSSYRDEESVHMREDHHCTGLVIQGPHGVGKSACVYACAMQLGYTVLEVNLVTASKEMSLEKWVGEATQSHRMSTTSKRAASLILFDEIDLSSPLDARTLKELKSLLRKTKRPIVFTCNHFMEQLYSEESLRWVLLQNGKLPMSHCVSILQMIGVVECGVDVMRTQLTFSNVARILSYYNMDVRRSLLHLQLWLSTHVQNVPKWTARADVCVSSSSCSGVGGATINSKHERDLMTTVNGVRNTYLHTTDMDLDSVFRIADCLSLSDTIESHSQMDQRILDCEASMFRYDVDRHNELTHLPPLAMECSDLCSCNDFQASFLLTHLDMAEQCAAWSYPEVTSVDNVQERYLGLMDDRDTHPPQLYELAKENYVYEFWNSLQRCTMKKRGDPKRFLCSSTTFLLDYLPHLHNMSWLTELSAGRTRSRKSRSVFICC